MNLDQLHKIVKRLDALLSDRQHGLATWNIALRDALLEIMRLCAEAGLKP